jgi:hypothetical protein
MDSVIKNLENILYRELVNLNFVIMSSNWLHFHQFYGYPDCVKNLFDSQKYLFYVKSTMKFFNNYLVTRSKKLPGNELCMIITSPNVYDIILIIM